MKCKVLQRHPLHDVPARRESDFVSDSTWQGGGYFEFNSDASGFDNIQLSLQEVQRHPNYEIITEEQDNG